MNTLIKSHIVALAIIASFAFGHQAFAVTWAVETDDGFQRADTATSSNPGGAGNSWTDQAGNHANISGNLLQMTSNAAHEFGSAYLTRPSSEGSVDQRVTEFYDLIADSTHWNSVVLRYNPSSGNGWYFLQNNPGDPSIQAFYLNSDGTVNHQIGTNVNTGTLNYTHYYALDAQIAGTAVTLTLYDQGTTPPAQTGAIPAFGTQVAQFTGTDSSWAGTTSSLSGVAVNANLTGVSNKLRRVITYSPLSTITMTGPVSRQVFQRSGTTGSIAISGSRDIVANHDIEASFNGGAYQTIVSGGTSGSFSGTLTGQTQGQGTLRVRLKEMTSASTTVSLVGIGDVYIVAGQSNASGRATNNQSYVSSGGLTASLFGNDYVWHDLTDPTDSNTSQVDAISQENSASNATGASQGNPGGSYWPLLASYILANQHVPVAFVPTALGATPITSWLPGSNHQDRSTLYGSMVYRALAVGGVRAVLWHQGETDGHNGMSSTTYQSNMQTLAAAIRSDLGVKLIPANLETGGTYVTSGQLSAINSAIATEWGSDSNVLMGPNIVTLSSDDANGHLMTDVNNASAALLWWNALNATTYLPTPAAVHSKFNISSLTKLIFHVGSKFIIK